MDGTASGAKAAGSAAHCCHRRLAGAASGIRRSAVTIGAANQIQKGIFEVYRRFRVVAGIKAAVLLGKFYQTR